MSDGTINYSSAIVKPRNGRRALYRVTGTLTHWKSGKAIHGKNTERHEFVCLLPGPLAGYDLDKIRGRKR